MIKCISGAEEQQREQINDIELVESRDVREAGKNNKKENMKKNAKRKSKKNKRNKSKKKSGRKSKRKGRKSRKMKNKSGRGKKMGRKSRKNKKSQVKKKGRKSSSIRSSTCLNFTCIDDAVSYLKLLKDRVANHEKQNARITRQNKTGSGKSGKKGVFGPVVRRIVENGGGNASNLTCNGKKNSGAAQLTNLTETLLKCEDEIKNACDPSNLPQPNMTEVATCNEAITTFKSKTGECIKKTGAEACTCWDDETIASDAATIRKCDCKYQPVPPNMQLFFLSVFKIKGLCQGFEELHKCL